VDYDSDRDLDLFIGASIGGAVHLYENIGNGSQPQFQLKKTIRHAFNVDDAIPFLYDWTGDGIFDLFAGERNGAILYYRGVAAGSFTFVQKEFANLDVGFYAAPAFVDINGDRRVDLFVGEGDGGVNFFQGTGSAAVAHLKTPPHFLELNVYPNPFREQLQIALHVRNEAVATTPQAAVYNLVGARVAEIEMVRSPNGQWRGVWAPSPAKLVSGVYFLQVNFNRDRINRKILFIQR
jgi:hypothetical protein